VNESFFERPTPNSPYAYSARHRELDDEGQPTNHIVESRRAWELITPVPKLQKRRRSPGQMELGLDATDGLSTTEQEYNPIPVINEIRGYVAAWRNCRTPEAEKDLRVIRPCRRRYARRVIALR
jgi:type III restriction enzyme